MVDKFSQHAHVRQGALGNWCEHCSPRTRHAALTTVAHRDGWVKVSERLNYLANVGNRKNNAHLRVVAREDQRWAARHEPGHRETDHYAPLRSE